MIEPDIHLNEFTKDGWRDIAFFIYPDITDEEFDTLWQGFVEWKEKRNVQ